jgi:hypothetical protein
MLVMTFNLRFANPVDGANEWQFRKDLVVDVIRRQAPDLLATQEGTVPMLRFRSPTGLPAPDSSSPGGRNPPVSHHLYRRDC